MNKGQIWKIERTVDGKWQVAAVLSKEMTVAAFKGNAKITINGQEVLIPFEGETTSDVPDPHIVASVEPSSIQPGEPAKLSWHSTNAQIVELDGDPVPLSGSVSVSPSATRTYRFEARRGDEFTTAQVQLVVATTSALSIEASVVPNRIRPTEFAKLSWHSENADAVKLGSSAVPLNGMRTVGPGVTHTYVFEATRGAEKKIASARLIVEPVEEPSPEPFDVEVTPNHFASGSGSNVDSIAFWQSTDATKSLMFVTSKGNDLIEIYKYPYKVQSDTLSINGRANGVAVRNDHLYVGVAGINPRVEVYRILPEFVLVKTIGEGTILRGETNLDILQTRGSARAYVSDDTPRVLGFDVLSGDHEVTISLPFSSVETVLCDNFHQTVVIPDEDGTKGVHVFNPEGAPVRDFGAGEFQDDAEGITLYDMGNGSGWYIVSDQRSDQTDFEVFDRVSGKHLGRFRLTGVANSDGCALSQQLSSEYPLGVFAAINDDTNTAVVSWEKVLDAIIGTPPPPSGPTLSVDVDEDHIVQGETVTLSWQSQDADTVTLDGVPVPELGTKDVSPSQTTDYIFVASNNLGSVTKQVRVTVDTVGPPPPSGEGIWIEPDRLMSLPTSGPAWEGVVDRAERDWGPVEFDDTHFDHDVRLLAGALVAARTEDSRLSQRVADGINQAVAATGTLRKVHQLARPMYGYAIAADLIDYRASSVVDWFRKMVDAPITGHSGTEGIRETARKIANNHGTAARGALAAIGAFLRDDRMLEVAAQGHLEYIGEPTREKLMIYEDTTWHADPNNKAGINRKGATRDGHSIDGVMPEDTRRGTFDFQWPPKHTLYYWTGYEPELVCAYILDRLNLVPWSAGDYAMQRAYDWLYDVGGWEAEGDDTWQPYLVNWMVGADRYPYPPQPTRPGKGVGYTDWTHNRTLDI